ncbi:MAG: UMP kinase [Patescibacteria group bacterium]|jgi:uridylate kinase
MKYKRILLKLSGEALLGNDHNIDPKACDFVAGEIKELVGVGTEVVVVLGGGNIFRGRAAEEHGMKRITGDYIGMLATVMNSLALRSALSKIDVESRVASALDMPKVCEPYIRDKAIRHLEKGRVVIAAAGSGNPYFSTDTAAAIRACELDCNIVLKATKVDGVYDKDPVKNADAVKIPNLTYLDVINKKIEVMDSTAITLCMDNAVPICVFELMKHGNIKKVVMGETVGTIIN